MFQMAWRLVGMCRWLYCTCLLSLKQFRPVPLAPQWYFSLGGCVGPERSIFLNRRIFHSQGNISLWAGVLVLKGLNYKTVDRRLHWACYLLIKRVYVTCYWLGRVCVWLGTEGSTSHVPCYCTERLLCPLGLTRSHQLDNTPTKSTVPANDEMANYKLRAFN